MSINKEEIQALIQLLDDPSREVNQAVTQNLLEHGDKVIIAQNGVFGGRMKEVAERCGATAVMAPKFYAFIASGQYKGLLGGMKGAAEYEILVKKKDSAVTGMSAQSLVHLLIIALVILGNISFFMGQRRKTEETV